MKTLIGSYSGGGCKPMGIMGEITVKLDYENGVKLEEEKYVVYYSEAIVKKILQMDTEVIDYIQRMHKIRQEIITQD